VASCAAVVADYLTPDAILPDEESATDSVSALAPVMDSLVVDLDLAWDSDQEVVGPMVLDLALESAQVLVLGSVVRAPASGSELALVQGLEDLVAASESVLGQETVSMVLDQVSESALALGQDWQAPVLASASATDLVQLTTSLMTSRVLASHWALDLVPELTSKPLRL